MELLTVCRSCMVEVASWELQNFDSDALKMFSFCTNVEISEDDKLPKQFCCDCRIKIESSYTFIKKAQEVNVTLHNLVSCAETNVIVKTENLTNEEQNNEANTLESDSGFSFEVKMDDNEGKFINPDSNQTIEYKMVFDIYPNSPDNSENELQELDIKLNANTEKNYKDSERISKDDELEIKQKTTHSKKASNCRNRNKVHKKKEAKKSQKEVPDLDTGKTKLRKLKVREKSEVEKKFQCDICKLFFTSRSGVLRHIMNKHACNNTNTKTCAICNRKFISAVWFSRHVKNEHRKQYSCPHCPMSFNKIGSYRHHKRKHAESLRFACGECDARFMLGTQLAKHALAQAHARPHVCTKCGEAYKTKLLLNGHIMSHLEEKSYLCSICGYSCNKQTLLDIHMMHHTGIKKFSCAECSYRTSTSGALRLHERRHRGERRFSCPHCGKWFYDPYGLRRHERRMHTGERPYPCYVCSEAFTESWNCKQHIMKVHHIAFKDIRRICKKTREEPLPIPEPECT